MVLSEFAQLVMLLAMEELAQKALLQSGLTVATPAFGYAYRPNVILHKMFVRLFNDIEYAPAFNFRAMIDKLIAAHDHSTLGMVLG